MFRLLTYCHSNSDQNQTMFISCLFLDSTIDYLAQYRLVDRSRLEMYGRAFTLEDDNEDGIISYEVFQSYVYTRRDNENDFISKVYSFKENKAQLHKVLFFFLFLQQMLLALEGVPSIAGMSRKQLLFVLQVKSHQRR